MCKKENKSSTINLRVSETERNELETVAQYKNMSISEYSRKMLFGNDFKVSPEMLIFIINWINDMRKKSPEMALYLDILDEAVNKQWQ